MKQWLLCTLASTICAAEASAAPSAAVGGDDWATLDRDIAALSASSLQTETDGPTVSGLVRAAWLSLPNLLPGDEDLQGFSLLNTQVQVDDELSDRVAYRIQLEAAGGNARLLDAFGAYRVNDLLRITVGNFRAPLLWESQLSDRDTLFLVRTDAGELFYGRDQGVMVDGSWERFNWKASLQNGVDTQESRASFCARVGVNAIGKGVGLLQGAYGMGDETNLSVAAAFYNDSGVDKDGSVYSTDAQLRVGRFAADGSFTSYGDGTNGHFATRTDANSWSASVSYMVVPDQWEVAARYQDIDNDKDASDITVGVNYYVMGHSAKVQANLTHVDSDDPPVDDTWRAGIGFTVGV
ncbi:MAG: porin [Planctomycetota bacterium]